jgi:hypothetical protein
MHLALQTHGLYGAHFIGNRFNISNTFLTVDSLEDGGVDISRASENIRENIKASATEMN